MVTYQKWVYRRVWGENKTLPYFFISTLFQPGMSPAVTRHVTNSDINLMSWQSSQRQTCGLSYHLGLFLTGCDRCSCESKDSLDSEKRTEPVLKRPDDGNCALSNRPKAAF
ncbi:hypothetical protein F5Y07DRAFT_382618 [Xylaria sp. FL0933]|nr:hypothetical protein F5Y07DRAFT_382618 [Xylaria sp. FL0933]